MTITSTTAPPKITPAHLIALAAIDGGQVRDRHDEFPTEDTPRVHLNVLRRLYGLDLAVRTSDGAVALTDLGKQTLAVGHLPAVTPAQLHALRGIAAGLIRDGGQPIGRFGNRPVRTDVSDRLFIGRLVRSIPGTFGGIELTDLGRAVLARDGDGCTPYRIEFDRIGRNHDVPPLDIRASCAGDIAQLVERHIRLHLGNRDVNVIVDPGAMKVDVLSRPSSWDDWATSGSGTITRVDEQKPEATA